MRVYYCTFVSDIEPDDTGKEVKIIEKSEGMPTADIVEFFNDLFDSVNGHLKKSDKSDSPLRCVISADSPHHAFWDDALKFLSNMMFVESSTGRKASNVKTIDSWITTIRSFKRLWKKLEGSNFHELKGRAVNQDPLENFFGQIRSVNSRNTRPTCYHFISAFSTLFINNLSSRRTIGANCESDNDRHLLTYTTDNTTDKDTEKTNTEIITFIAKLYTDCNDGQLKSHLTLNSFISKQVLKKQEFRDCADCSCTVNNGKGVIDAALRTLDANISRVCHERYLSSKLKKIVTTDVTITSQCNKHNIVDRLVSFTVEIFVKHWCETINKILRGHIVNVTSNSIIIQDAVNLHKNRLKNKNQS